jgi:hypothetical protein
LSQVSLSRLAPLTIYYVGAYAVIQLPYHPSQAANSVILQIGIDNWDSLAAREGYSGR